MLAHSNSGGGRVCQSDASGGKRGKAALPSKPNRDLSSPSWEEDFLRVGRPRTMIIMRFKDGVPTQHENDLYFSAASGLKNPNTDTRRLPPPRAFTTSGRSSVLPLDFQTSFVLLRHHEILPAKRRKKEILQLRADAEVQPGFSKAPIVADPPLNPPALSRSRGQSGKAHSSKLRE
ncbi:unnamed protein product [Pleuronectes platessa]|uniref:Uncharacterized protein n=1 Tax=Pleuronectes platessa TaxID=8262 RepID=A0A9N7Z956_PLEPL|nr:unnamed protein product [Pleuronectes platessa]